MIKKNNLFSFLAVLSLAVLSIAGSACSQKTTGGEDVGVDIVGDDGVVVPGEDPVDPAVPVNPCVPTTCQAEGANCGELADGCGNTLACGTCQDPLICGGSGVANVCGENDDGPGTPVAPLEPVTCYKYGFVSNRDGGKDNVYFGDTCRFSRLIRDLRPIDFGNVGSFRPPVASGPKKLTNNDDTNNYYGAIAFRPDGQQMVYGEAQYTDAQFFPNVFSGNPLTQDVFPQYFGLNPDPLFFSWSPDGAKQVVIGYDDVVVGPDILEDVIWVKEIYTYDLTNYHLTKIVANQSGSREFETALWHPTENKIIFTQQEGTGPYTIQVYNLTTGVMDNLFEQFGGSSQLRLQGFQPSIQPDGEGLAFTRTVNGVRQIFTCRFHTRTSGNRTGDTCENPERLTFQGENSEPSWTPDGAYLFFTSNRDGQTAIYKMKPDGTEQVRISPEGAREHGAMVYPISHTGF